MSLIERERLGYGWDVQTANDLFSWGSNRMLDYRDIANPLNLPAKMKIGRGSCNGTFGELVQGIIGDRPFLITLPIPSLCSHAVFFPDPAISEIRGADSKVKAIKAGRLLLQWFGVKGGGFIEIRSNIPIGKGLASSSADIAAMKSVAQSYSLPLTKEIISTISAMVEPTDGVMYEQIVSFDYIHGEMIESFGVLPPFTIVGIDTGGIVNTIEFNHVPKEYDKHDENQFSKAYGLVKKGFREKNLSFICMAATISARVNQKLLSKPFFSEFEKLAQEFEGGIVVAHSGTMIGILIDNSITRNNKDVTCHLFRQISLLFKDLYIKPIYYSSYV
jgi:L-threonine kinase